jgi:hypothetical protein
MGWTSDHMGKIEWGLLAPLPDGLGAFGTAAPHTGGLAAGMPPAREK